jgi:hypothetical protein
VVENGVITEFGIPHHIVQGFTHEFEMGDHMGDMAVFLRQEVEGSEGCWNDPRTPECARLIRDHLDEWAAWCGQLGMTGCENPGATSFRDGEVAFLDGDVTFAAARPWGHRSTGSPTAMTLVGGRNENVVITADPLTTVARCEYGPPAVNAEALAQSIMADPDFETIGTTPLHIAGIDGLQVDVDVVAADDIGVVCFLNQWALETDTGNARWRMRLYLVDYPGDAAQVLAIAVIAPEEVFEGVLEKATHIVESLEIHSG